MSTRMTAHDVADYLVLLARERGVRLNNMKLLPILYYAQAWHLAIFDTPLFDDELEAWAYTPTVPSVFWRFHKNGIHDIDDDVTRPDIPSETAEFLDELADEYFGYDEWELSDMIYQEAPWRNARRGLPQSEPIGARVSHDDMREYFRARLSAQAA